jgi:hypothetical protein
MIQLSLNKVNLNSRFEREKQSIKEKENIKMRRGRESKNLEKHE